MNPLHMHVPLKSGATELFQLLKNLGNDITYEKLVEVMQCYDKDGRTNV